MGLSRTLNVRNHPPALIKAWGSKGIFLEWKTVYGNEVVRLYGNREFIMGRAPAGAGIKRHGPPIHATFFKRDPCGGGSGGDHLPRPYLGVTFPRHPVHQSSSGETRDILFCPGRQCRAARRNLVAARKANVKATEIARLGLFLCDAFQLHPLGRSWAD